MQNDESKQAFYGKLHTFLLNFAIRAEISVCLDLTQHIKLHYAEMRQLLGGHPLLFLFFLQVLLVLCSVDLMENADGEDETECGEAELRHKVEVLKQELRECRAELSKLQKQLSQSERLQKSTESYNEDLRKQVGEEDR